MRSEAGKQTGEFLLGRRQAFGRDYVEYDRVSVVLSGDLLAIEYRDGGSSETFEVGPGHVGWDEPTGRVHRGVNVGEEPYEEITVFFLESPDAVPQPTE